MFVLLTGGKREFLNWKQANKWKNSLFGKILKAVLHYRQSQFFLYQSLIIIIFFIIYIHSVALPTDGCWRSGPAREQLETVQPCSRTPQQGECLLAQAAEVWNIASMVCYWFTPENRPAAVLLSALFWLKYWCFFFFFTLKSEKSDLWTQT